MYRLAQFFCWLLLFGASKFSIAVASESSIDVRALVLQAESKGLVNHPYWIALMHYRRNGFMAKGEVVSEIISPDFFLSPFGRENSRAELAATLEAFFVPPDKDPDGHAQCRFIARYKWLRKSLDWEGITPPSVTCEQYNLWSLNEQINSLSLVFVSGYFENPASFYGHLLLKFNTNRKLSSGSLLDQSVNYGAIVSEDDNALEYMFRGVFGGYDATFSHAQFYRHNHNYGESELRDMWEYELALNKEEVEQIISHGWELLGNKFVYYFLNKNCAYQMAELLELVIDREIISRNIPWTMPVSIFERLVTIKRNEVPIVKKIRYIPSRQKRFYEQYSMLGSAQKNIVKSFVEAPSGLDVIDYQELSEIDKIEIVDTLIDYYEFRIVSKDDDIELKAIKHKLLIERIQLPSKELILTEGWQGESPPHDGPLPGMIRSGIIHNSKFDYGIEVNMRPANYDFLSLSAGRPENSNLTMFDLSVIHADSKLWLRKLDIVNIEALNLSKTSLPDDGGYAWKIKFGFEGNDLSCDENDCVVFNLIGGVGKALEISDSIVAYGMIEVNTQSHYQDFGTLGAAMKAVLVASPMEGWKTKVSIGNKKFMNGSRTSERLIGWENRFGSDRNWDVRIAYDKNVEREFKTAVSIYW